MLDVLSKIFLSAQVTGAGAVDNLSRSLGKLHSQSVTLKSGLEFAKRAAETFGLAISAIGIEEFIRHTVEMAAETGKLAQRLGLTTEQLSVWRYAVNQNGVSMDAFTAGVQKLGKTLYEAEKGNAKAIATMKDFGFTTKELREGSVSMDEALRRVADHVASMKDGFEKTGEVTAAFGRGGAALIPVFEGGSKAIDDFGTRAARLGIIISEDTSKKAEDFVRTMKDVGAGTEGVGLLIVKDLLPTFEGVAKGMLDIINTGGPTDDFFKGLGEEVRLVASAVVLLVSGLKELFVGFETGVKIAAHAAMLDMDGIVRDAQEGNDKLTRIAQGTQKSFEDIWKDSGFNANGLPDTIARPKGAAETGAAGGEGGVESTAFLDYLRQLQEESAKLSYDTSYLTTYGHAAESSARATLEFQLARGKLADAGLNEKERAQLRAAADAVDRYAAAKKHAEIVINNSEAINKEQIRLDALRTEIGLLGQSRVEIEKVEALKKIDLEFANRSKGLNAQERADLEAQTDDLKAQAMALIQLRYERERSFDVGLQTAMGNYVEAATNAALQTESIFGTVMGGLEHLIDNFVQHGKLSFRDFVSTVLIELERLETKEILGQILKLVGPTISGLFSGATPDTVEAQPYDAGAQPITVPGSQSGGLVTGPGSTTSDSVPMFLSNGEYVLSAAAVGRIGVPALNAMNEGGMPGKVPPVFNFTYNMDARGADAESVRRLGEAMEATRRKTLADVQEMLRRGSFT